MGFKLTQGAIGLKIKKLRESKGITQEELARYCGYSSKAAISKIERGVSDISRSKLCLIAQALGVNAAEILFEGDLPVETAYTNDEKEFIEVYRSASQYARLKAYAMLLNGGKNNDETLS